MINLHYFYRFARVLFSTVTIILLLLINSGYAGTHGASCDGTPIDAIPATFPDTPTTYVIQGNVTIESEVVVPAQVSLCITDEGRLEMGSNATLTIHSDFTAAVQEVFTGWEEIDYRICKAEPKQSVVLPLDITLHPEWFGAKGDGITNDTTAMARTGQAIGVRGGGRVEFQPDTTYIVGAQTFQGCDRTLHYAYTANPVLRIENTTKPVYIDGRGATLHAQPGLHFGAHDFESGEPLYHGMTKDYFVHKHISNAYRGMIDLIGNTEVLIENIELDGNDEALVVGGVYGDSGRQNAAMGINASGNNKLTIRNVYTHHHALDGINIDHNNLRESDPATPVLIEDIVSEHNWRLGLSLTGGIDTTIRRSTFNHQGTGAYHSSPASGIDIEAEGTSVIRDVLIEDTAMENNRFWGLIAASGDTARITIRRSRMWGPASLVASQPYITIEDSELFGELTKPWGEPVCDPNDSDSLCDRRHPHHPDNRKDVTERVWGDNSEATAFRGCLFEDRDTPWMVANNLSWSSRPNPVLIHFTAGHNVLIEQSVVRTQHAKALFLGVKHTKHELDEIQVLRDVYIEHGSSRLPAHTFQSLIAGAYLDRVCFNETSDLSDSDGKWYIHPEGNVFGNGIHVSGPSVKWKHWNGGFGLAGKLAGRLPYTDEFDYETSSCPHGFDVPLNLDINPGPGEAYTFRPRQPPVDNNKGSCFIATAAAGTDLVGDINIIRAFRDKNLSPNVWGQYLVNLYYRISPSIEEYIRQYEMVRTATIWGLAAVIYGIKYPRFLL